MNDKRDATEVRDWSETPLFGRAALMSGARSIQMFGSVFTDVGGVLTVAPEVELPPGLWARQQTPTQNCERLWRLSSAGVSVQRYLANNAPHTPLTNAQIANATSLPAGASRSAQAFYKVALDVARSTGFARYIIDIGQTLDIYAYRAEASIIGPLGAIEITPGNIGEESSIRRGLVVDALIGASLLPIEESISNSTFKATQRLSVPINTQSTIAVPRSAVGVKIFQSNVGVSSGDWTKHVGDPAILASTLITGVISFNNRVSLAENSDILDETHLRTDSNAVDARVFSIHWTIRP